MSFTHFHDEELWELDEPFGFESAELPEIERMYEPVDFPVMHFVPDFSKGLEENFTREKQLQAGPTFSCTVTQRQVERAEPPAEVEAAKDEMHEDRESSKEDLSEGDANDEDSDESDFEGISSGRRHRWGKAKDKRLFELLRHFEREGRLSMSNPYKPGDPGSKAVFKELIRVIGWKGSKRRLLSRIKLIQENILFSVRDIKYLKRVLKKEYRNKVVDYDKVLFDFPGKTRQQIIEVVDKLRAPKRSKRSTK